MSENIESKEFMNLGFVEKCKKDPVIPVCLILAFVSVIGAVIYFMLPFRTPAMGITLDEFKEKYESTELYTNLFAPFSLEISPVTYVDTSTVPTEDFNNYSYDDNFGELSMTENDPNCDYFQVALNRDIITLMQGSSRKVDGKLTSLRFITKYDQDPTYMSYYYACILEALYPELDPSSAIAVLADMLKVYDINTQGGYTVMGDYAFRIMYIPANGGNYFAFDVVPSASVKADEISNTLLLEDVVIASGTEETPAV